MRVVELPDLVAQGGAEAHGLGDPQIAGVGAGAGGDVIDSARAGCGKSEFVEGLVKRPQAGEGDEGEQQVLVDGDADEAIPGAGGEPGDAAQLFAGEVALVGAHGDGGVAGLTLFDHIGFEPCIVCGVAAGCGLQDGEEGAIA